jgi:hypothetical protein
VATYTLSASGDDSSAGSLSIGKGPTNSTVTTTTANPLPIGRHSSTSDCYSAAFRFTGITETSITAATAEIIVLNFALPSTLVKFTPNAATAGTVWIDGIVGSHPKRTGG